MLLKSRRLPGDGPERVRRYARGLEPLGHSMYQKDVKGHYGCVNSVEFSHSEDLIASGGDDKRVLIWSTSDMQLDAWPSPLGIMKGEHLANIFTHAFTLDNQKVYSSGNDGKIILHDIHSTETVRSWMGMRAVYNLAVSPVDPNLVAASTDNSRVYFYDQRAAAGDPPLVIRARCRGTSMYSGQFNPAVPSLFAVASDHDGLAIYDIRNLSRKLIDLFKISPSGCMYADWNSSGSMLAVNLQRNYPIVLDLMSKRVTRLKDPCYKSIHTIKSITFVDDDVIMMGSDEFGIFAWDLKHLEMNPPQQRREIVGLPEIIRRRQPTYDDTISHASAILRGHRSIVNHVRYSTVHKMAMSCGIEKIVKVWSPMNLPGSYLEPNLRNIREVNNGHLDIADDEGGDDGQTVDEDLHMLRYFDRLILNSGDVQMGDSVLDILAADSRSDGSDSELYSSDEEDRHVDHVSLMRLLQEELLAGGDLRDLIERGEEAAEEQAADIDADDERQEGQSVNTEEGTSRNISGRLRTELERSRRMRLLNRRRMFTASSGPSRSGILGTDSSDSDSSAGDARRARPSAADQDRAPGSSFVISSPSESLSSSSGENSDSEMEEDDLNAPSSDSAVQADSDDSDSYEYQTATSEIEEIGEWPPPEVRRQDRDELDLDLDSGDSD